MKARSLYYSLFALLACVSCEQLGPVDDISPKHVLTDKNVFTDASSTEAVLNGVYKQWRNQGITPMRNTMFQLTGTTVSSSVNGSSSFKINDIKPTSSVVLNYYMDLYFLINQANTIIHGLPEATPKKLSDERKKEILGEAYFNRALAEVMLLRSFGEFWDMSSSYGIVLYNEPVLDNKPKARSSVTDCYDQILNDLNKALDCPAYSGVSYRATRLSVKALKTKILLYQNEFQKAIELADEVIKESNVAGAFLENSYTDLFNKGFESKEVLFSLYTSYPQEVINVGIYNDFFYNGYEGSTVAKIADELYGLLDDGNLVTGTGMDPRYAGIYQIIGEGDDTKFQMNKYPNNINGSDVNTYYFLRLGEIYLIKAEAAARLSLYEEARKSLKTITDRAGYDESYVDQISNSGLLLSIFRHKYIELSAENYEEWYDMVRYHELDGIDFTHLGYIRSDRHKILPIPYDAMAGNGLLVQNPSYVN